MKRILRILAIAAICGILVAPQVEARGNRPSQSQSGGGPRNGGYRSGGRAGGGNATPSRPSTPSRPGTPSRPSNAGNPGGNRPGNTAAMPGNNGNRPGNPGVATGGNNGFRPNNPGNTPGRNPGVTAGNNGNRPGNPGNNGFRPNNPGSNGFRPNNPGNNGLRPGQPARPNRPAHSVPPPHRPNFATPWTAPRPPRGWRPGRLYPTFSTILGITLGTAFDLSLNYLYNNGYNVYSYGNNAVYLTNVNQLNLLWPDATLYYGSAGLDRGEFIYSTSYYDTARYNEAYARLVASYGAPVSTSYPSNGMETCWFGNDGRFVTLQFAPTYGADGVLRYYTTLSFGM